MLKLNINQGERNAVKLKTSRAFAEEQLPEIIANAQTENLEILIGGTYVLLLILLGPLVLGLSTLSRLSLWAMAPLLLWAGITLVAQYLLKTKKLYHPAARVYTLGLLLTQAVVMTTIGGELIRTAAPFFLILIAFIAGMLLPPKTAFSYTLLGGAWLIGFAIWRGPTFYDVIAFLCATLAAGIAYLAEGSLYSATEWSLEGYRRAAQRAAELASSREALRQAVKSRDYLTNQLMEANASLTYARAAAEQARAVAEEANRLKTQFVANMSHELRTPLNAIINFTRIVAEGYDGPVNDEQRAHLDYVRFAGEHLLGLINDILDLAKIEAGKMEIYPEPLDLHPIFKGVMSTAVGLTRDKGLYLKMEAPEQLPLVYADPKRVRQVLLNLLSNAAKFTPSGGITLRAYVEEPYLVVAVADTGIGIAPENFAQVFEEFRQVDESFARQAGGTGLGIPISKKLIEMHGGTLWLESQVGEGSTFFFSLPLYQPPAPAPADQ